MEKYKLLFKCFFRKKKLIKYCLRMFGIIIISFLLLLGIKDRLILKFSSLKHKGISNYYILVNFNNSGFYGIENIKRIDHIKNAYYLMSIEEDYLYAYIDSNLYDISSGKDIEKNNEILLPKNNQSIDINNKQLKIVGTYNIINNFLMMPDNLVITSYNYIIEKTIDNPKKSILIEVDDYNNVYDVSNALESKYECSVNIYDSGSDILSKYDLFINITEIILKILLIISSILFVVLGITFMHDERDDNINLKVLGYSNMIVITSTLLKVTSLFLLAFLLSLIPSVVIMIIFNSIFAINIANIINIILLLYLILFLSITTLTLFNRKKRLIRE